MFLWHIKLTSPDVGRIAIPCLTKESSLTRIEELLEDSVFCNATLHSVEMLGGIDADKEGLGLHVPWR